MTFQSRNRVLDKRQKPAVLIKPGSSLVCLERQFQAAPRRVTENEAGQKGRVIS